MEKSIISMAIVNSYVCLPEGMTLWPSNSGIKSTFSPCYQPANWDAHRSNLHEES